MSTINKKLMGFIFSGAALNLASAAFKGSLNSITGFNSAGTAYASFRPTSNFNSLTQLVSDGAYIVDAKTTGFDIPGAILTAVSGGGGGSDTLTLTADADGFLVTEFQAVTHTAKATLSGAITSGSALLEASVDGGVYGTLAAANAAIQAAALPYATQFRITRTVISNAATAAITISY